MKTLQILNTIFLALAVFGCGHSARPSLPPQPLESVENLAFAGDWKSTEGHEQGTVTFAFISDVDVSIKIEGTMCGEMTTGTYVYDSETFVLTLTHDDGEWTVGGSVEGEDITADYRISSATCEDRGDMELSLAGLWAPEPVEPEPRERHVATMLLLGEDGETLCTTDVVVVE